MLVSYSVAHRGGLDFHVPTGSGQVVDAPTLINFQIMNALYQCPACLGSMGEAMVLHELHKVFMSAIH